jgi:geranylgeranyl reductase family protein
VIIAGGGPAGATATLYCRRHGLKTLLLDKSRFPRDKVCGDAISGKSLRVLRDLDLERKLRLAPQVEAHGVLFSAPNGKVARIPFTPPRAKRQSMGYVCRRVVFDHVLFSAAKEASTDCFEEFVVDRLVKDGEQVQGVEGHFIHDKTPRAFHAKVVLGADGFDSVVARQTGLYAHDSEHWCVATRAYYRGLADLSDYIEIHFIDAVSPGYFWIFPLENGWANVGIGMLHSALKKHRINLKQAHLTATQVEPFKTRFARAELAGNIVGWNLPLGSKQRTIHGDGFMLLGDAAGLIDPFSGEGIGNAMVSGEIAARVLARACARNEVSAASLSEYAELLWKELGNELKTSRLLQRIGQVKPLLNFVVGKAAKSMEVAHWISSMMANETPRAELASPLTYLRLLFA